MGSIPAKPDSDSARAPYISRHLGWVGLMLAFGVFWLQTLPYIGAVSACENVDGGTSRADLCHLMSPWGHVWILAVPSIIVLTGGIWGQRIRQPGVLLACIAGAILAGIGIPLIAFEATSPR